MKKKQKPESRYKKELNNLKQKYAELERRNSERLQALEKYAKLSAQLFVLLNQSENKTGLIRDILLSIKDALGFQAVGIRLKEDEDYPYYESNGFSEDFLLTENYLCTRDNKGNLIRDDNGNPLLECMCGNIICGRTDPSLPFFTKGRSFWSNCTTELLASTSDKDRQAHTRNRCNGVGYESVALIPLRSDNKTIGLLQLNDRRKNMFTLEMIEFFEKIGSSVGISLERKRTMEELINHRNNLEKLVAEKVAEVKKANERLNASNQQLRADEQQLRASEQQLKASNQQLRASEQQLRAFNQQLRASEQQLRASEQQLKATKQQLQESEARYRNLIEETHEIIQSIAPDGSFIFVNPAWFKIFGYTKDELKKMKFFDIIHPDSLKKCQELFHEVMSGESVDNIETTFVAKNGKCIIVEGTAVPRLHEGKVIATHGFFRDVTKSKQTETEKEKIQAQLFQSQKMEAIGTLSAGVAHDFNNLLTTIQGNVYLAMLEIDKNSTLAKDLEEIKVAASRAASLTQQLLLFSKKQPMGLVSLNINKTIEDLVKMLKRLISEDIKINIQLDPELWIINADEVNIEQVITNLTVNARDAMPKGGIITLKTENIIIEEKQKNTIPNSRVGRFVRLSVEDTGVGMDKDTISRIFEPFFSTKESGKGTGLGMSVVYGIIKQHNGWINVYSEPGQGSIFKIYLPAATSKKEAKIKEKAQISSMRGDNERILLVEDDEAICKFAIRLLENNNYTVFSAGNIKDTMKIFKKENKNFDLIISDMVLTDGTGIDLIEKMISNNPKLKILLTSGYLDEKSQWPIIKMKGYKFLQKPYEINKLLEAIRRLLSESKNHNN